MDDDQGTVTKLQHALCKAMDSYNQFIAFDNDINEQLKTITEEYVRFGTETADKFKDKT